MEAFEHLREFYRISSLSMHCVCEDREEKIGEWFSLQDVFPDVEGALLHSGRPAVYTVSPNHAAFALIRFPDGQGYLFLGPAVPFDPIEEVVEEMIRYAGGDPARKGELSGYLHEIPKQDLQSLLAVAGYLCRTVFDFIPPEWSYMDYPLPAAEGERYLSERPTIEVEVDEESFPEQTLRFSLELTRAISHGQVDRVKTLMGQIFQISPLHTTIQMQTVRDSFVLSLSMASMAAMQGGFSATACTLLMQEYMRELTKPKSLRQIVSLLKTMMTDFAIRVHQSQILQPTDPVSRKICREVEEHLYEKVNPTMIAGRLGYSVPYLCSQFKSATGLTITDYIHQRKTAEAKTLLDQPGANVTDVAMRLGYSTASYFSTVFKKEAGITPVEYLRTREDSGLL